MTTKVIFRKYKDGSIIALFPELPGTNDLATCLSYMHVGQHSAATASISGTLPATPEEYEPLKKELERIGYDLMVIDRFNVNHRRARAAVIRHHTLIETDTAL